jgi:hypothetical protein
MAHFYGTLQGHRGQASRLGTAKSGIGTTTASWQGAVKVELYQNGDVDIARVVLIPWNGAGITRVLYEGPVGGKAAWTRARRRRERIAREAEARRLAEPPVTTTEDAGTADALVPISLEVEDPARWAEYNRRWNALLGGDR